MKFTDLPLQPAVQNALEAMGFDEATPVQAATIPALLEGRDLLGQAHTGTGKTAAFGIPLIEAAHKGRRGLVLTPTRELAKQVQRELQAIGKGSPVDVVCLIGGAPFGEQARALGRHPMAMLVATPGRILDHLTRGTLDVDDMSLLVLDEADEMLSMGFQDELDAIVAKLPQDRQTILFSATVAKQVEKLARKALKDPEVVRIGGGATGQVRQCFAIVPGRARSGAVGRIIAGEAPKAALMFARTRARVDELVDELRPLGAEALHGGMQQGARDGVMARFRAGNTRLLVATDVAARGLDVDDIDLVLHDEPAGDTDTYIHRIGRTGRAGRTGTSILFVGPGKMRRLQPLNRIVGALEKYEVPDAADVAKMQAGRLLEEVRLTIPSPPAQDLLKQALASGLSAHEVAERALEALLEASMEVPEEAPKSSGGAGALALKVGSMDNVNPGAIVAVLCNVGGLRAEDIGRIDILEKMSVVEVPATEMDRLCTSLSGAVLSRRKLMPRAAEDWRFKAQSR